MKHTYQKHGQFLLFDFTHGIDSYNLSFFEIATLDNNNEI